MLEKKTFETLKKRKITFSVACIIPLLLTVLAYSELPYVFSLIEVIMDLLPPFWVSWCLSSRKNASVLPLSVCSFGLCLGRTHIFFDLDCPSSVWLSSLGLRPLLYNYQTLAGQSRSQEMKILLRQRNFAIKLCHLWASLQIQHRTFIPRTSTLNILCVLIKKVSPSKESPVWLHYRGTRVWFRARWVTVLL